MRSTTGILLVASVMACRAAPDQATREGRLEVRWTGSEPGKLASSATAGWCGSRRMLEIRAIQGDTGVALAVYPKESLTAGTYPVVDPARAESIPPAVGVALRWLGPRTVQGFQGDSGSVRLERSGSGQISGQVSARARSVVDTERVRLRGSFRDLTLQPQSSNCGSEARPQEDAAPEDTSVH